MANFCKYAYLLHKPQILISMTVISGDTTSQALVHLDNSCYRWAETLDMLWSTIGSALLQTPALSSHTGGTRHPPAVQMHAFWEESFLSTSAPAVKQLMAAHSGRVWGKTPVQSELKLLSINNRGRGIRPCDVTQTDGSIWERGKDFSR